MKKNLGSADRIARILFALVAAGLILTNVVSGSLAIILGIVSIVFLATALVGTCPIYLAMKWSTKKIEKIA